MSGMTPILNKIDVTRPDPGVHAHLLVTESGGLVALESPAAIMEEVEFRATHVSSLMEEMFKEAGKHDLWEIDEA